MLDYVLACNWPFVSQINFNVVLNENYGMAREFAVMHHITRYSSEVHLSYKDVRRSVPFRPQVHFERSKHSTLDGIRNIHMFIVAQSCEGPSL